MKLTSQGQVRLVGLCSETTGVSGGGEGVPPIAGMGMLWLSLLMHLERALVCFDHVFSVPPELKRTWCAVPE